MAFQFPASPVVGQTYTPSAGLTFKWNGTAWYLVNSTLLTPTEADTRYVQIANARSMESRIINGGFAINQRFAGTAVTSVGDGYKTDRWAVFTFGPGAFSIQRVIGAETPFAARMLVTTAAPSPAAGDYFLLSHTMEGNAIADMRFGLPQASAFTFACDLYCNIAGTFPIAFRNGGGPQLSYIATVTIPAATWTPIRITVPGPTSGTWNSDNNIGLTVMLSLFVGSTLHAPAANSWQTGNFFGVAGCTNLMSAAGQEMYIRSARLYPGSIDYGPCQRLYADELRLCQRYYEKSYDVGTVPGTATSVGSMLTVYPVANQNFYGTIYFKVTKRSVPTVTFYHPGTGATGTWSTESGAKTPIVDAGTGESALLFGIAGTGMTAADSIRGHWTASAEL